MSLKKRILAAAAIIGTAAVIAGIGISGRMVSEETDNSIFQRDKETIYFWYTDEALTDYLNSAAVTFGESHHIRVIPVLTSGLEYLESVNKASMDSKTPPDLYIIGNDSLEKAFLAGLASEIPPSEWEKIKEEYPDAARLAVTYKSKEIAYPFYFETSALVYNRTYLEESARKSLEAEQDVMQAEEAMTDLEENGPPPVEEELTEGEMADVEPDSEKSAAPIDREQVEERMKQQLPSKIGDILSFANEYDAPEQVEAVFKWDVTDIFYNYFFAGNYLVVGGQAGDSPENMNIYNKQAIDCLRVYQDLNQFFSIDTKEISYDKIISDFIAGKIVYTVGTTDVVAKLEEAKKNGEFIYDYGIAPVPDISDELLTRSLSVTNCVVVNGFSEQQELAGAFARFLTSEYTDTLYSRTGKAASRYGVDYGNDTLQEFANEYEISIPMPKMIATSNFWVELEIAFAQIWDGADVNESLRQLSEQIMTQVKGEPYTETVIEEEAAQTEEIEYLDEEQLRKEAMEEEQ